MMNSNYLFINKMNLVQKIREIKHLLIEILLKKRRNIYVEFLKVKM